MTQIEYVDQLFKDTTGKLSEMCHDGEIIDVLHNLYKECRSNQVIRLMAKIEDQQTKVKRLREWVNDLHSGMYINCVYCGHRYGPDPGTPVVMADVLKKHIEQCPEHPLSHMKRRAEEVEAEVEQLKRINAEDAITIKDYQLLLDAEERKTKELEAYVDILCKGKEAADQCADTADAEVGRLMARIKNDTDYRELKKEYESMMAERNYYYADWEKVVVQRDDLLDAAKAVVKSKRGEHLSAVIIAKLMEAIAKVKDGTLEKNNEGEVIGNDHIHMVRNTE